MFRSIFWASTVAFGASQLVSATLLAVTNHTIAESCRWDCNWYRTIADYGYDIEPSSGPRGDFANVGFFPALPLLARVVTYLSGIHTPDALVVVGKASFAIAIFWFVRFCLAYRPGIDVRLAAAVVAFQPYVIYGNVGYTEPLFLAVTCCVLALGREGKIVPAGLIAAIGTTVRLPVVFLAPALASRMWLPLIIRGRLPDAHSILAVVVVPLGLTLFSLYEYIHLGDGLAFVHIQRAWHPSENRPIALFFEALSEGVSIVVLIPTIIGDPAPIELLRELGAHRAYYAMTAIFAYGLSLVYFRSKDYDLFIFTLTSTIAPLTVSLSSMPRYVWWQAPILLCITCAISSRKWYSFAYFAMSALFVPITYFVWYSGFAFVV